MRPSLPSKKRKGALIEKIERAARARGERMTDVRRETALALAGLKKPQSAYKILAIINKKREKKLSAMSLYRALHYLIALGVAIKIDSTNSYALCDKNGGGQLIIVCDKCGALDEAHDDKALSSLTKLAKARGLSLRNRAVEIHGLCEKCHG